MPIRDVDHEPLDSDHASKSFLGYRPPVVAPFTYDLYSFLVKPLRDDDKKLGTELLKRFLQGPQIDFRRTYDAIRSMLVLSSYTRSPAAYLKELLFLMGFPGDPATVGIVDGLSELDMRRLLWASARLWKYKGTDISYEAISHRLGGIRLEITDWFRRRWLGYDGVIGKRGSSAGSWVVTTPGDAVEPDEYVVDIMVMDEPPLLVNRDLIVDLLRLVRPGYERLNIAFVEYIDQYRDGTDTTTVSGASSVTDGSLVHSANTMTVSAVHGAENWASVYVTWLLQVSTQAKGDAENKFRLVFHYFSPDYYDYVEVNLGAGTGTATVTLGRRWAGSETMLASATSRVNLDVGFDYSWSVQTAKYYTPGTMTRKQQTKVLVDGDLVLLHDEAVSGWVPTIGNVGEQSYKAVLEVLWKEVHQDPPDVRHIRPDLRIEPRFLEASPSSSQQFSAYGGGGRYVYSMLVNGSSGRVTPSGRYTAGSLPGKVDKVLLRDRFGATTYALVEVA